MNIPKKFAWTFLFLFLVSGVGCSSDKKTSQVGGSGDKAHEVAPNFRVKNLRGGVSALSDFRGKVVLVNFWATWCAPCRAEMPSMEALYRTYHKDGFEILAISIDTMGEPVVRAFIEEFGFTFPVLVDPQLIVNDLYKVRVVPTSILIDKEGLVIRRVLGARDWGDPELRLLIESLVKS